MAFLATLVSSGALLLAAGMAQSAVGPRDEVETATRAFYQALNAADPAAADKFLLPGGDSFPRSGKPLDPEPPTAEESLANLRALFARSLRFDVVIRDLRVTHYGTAAIATFYTVGHTTAPGGSTSGEATYRATYVWVKRQGVWKIAHFHLSPLVP
jgi:ketosteroid isomerase-like protein